MMTTSQDQIARLEAALALLTCRERLNVLLRLGVPAELVMGVGTCWEHPGWSLLPDVAPLSFEGDVVWCRGCFRWLKA